MRSAFTLCVVACAVWAVPVPGQDRPGPGAAMKADSPPGTDRIEKSGKLAALKGTDVELADEWREPRNVAAVAASIDGWVDAGLSSARVPASPAADDAQFFRRVTLDIIGRIPTYEEAVAFLESADPDKRSRWINELLASRLYGEHFATIWRELIAPNDGGVKKPARDSFSPWLTEQFNRNRGWDRIARDMLTAEGKIRETPQSGFILANSDNQEPQPNLLADATGRLFWGVQLRCAECHDHPFAPWKQADFWGTAAFFSRLRKGYTEGKNPSGLTL
ncbi:MAG: DUF1549 domain-containing protein, partial [Verrucomicrobiota bacterium]|nr:DUF1549 domain-containing protein [Verrucomicrobiota bacterium]